MRLIQTCVRLFLTQMQAQATDEIWSHERRKGLIGAYFEAFVHAAILGGNREEAEPFGADVAHWPLRALIEVKAVDNGHRPTIFLDQFEGHLSHAEFPFSHVIYALCCYRVKVRRGGKSRSDLAESTRTIPELKTYLARRTTEVFVIHHTLLRHILESGKAGRIRGRDTISVSRKELRKMALSKAELASLNLESLTMRVERRFQGRSFRFRLAVVCPPKLAQGIKRLVKGRKKKGGK